MIYVLAALLPPLGLLLNGQPFSAIFNLVLIVFCLVFGLVFHVLLLVPSAHALIAVHMKREDRRHREVVAGIDVRPFDHLRDIVAEHGVAIGVIATPAHAAQDVADRMVASGITSILNFAPSVIAVPAGVDVRKVDLSIELQILAYHEQRKAGQDNVS